MEIILGRKDVENRDWKPRIDTPFRLNIHAGKTFDDNAHYLARVAQLTHEQCASRMGALIGIVTVVAIHDGYACHGVCSSWADWSARWHWELSNAHAIDPIPMKGRLGLWEVPEDTWGPA
jgi:hypothetical protein